VGERWVHPPVVAREAPPAWIALWRFRLLALLLLALLVVAAVAVFRQVTGANAQDPGVEARATYAASS
jgi:cytochrome bd-type quinol oxidase subunit 1